MIEISHKYSQITAASMQQNYNRFRRCAAQLLKIVACETSSTIAKEKKNGIQNLKKMFGAPKRLI